MVDEKQTNEFLNVVEENKKLIYKVSRIYCDSPVDQQDLFQEIVANLWRAYPKFKGDSKISTYIYKVALNTSVTWFRDYAKRKGHVEEARLFPDIPNSDEKDGIYEQLYSAIGQLGKRERDEFPSIIRGNSSLSKIDFLNLIPKVRLIFL